MRNLLLLCCMLFCASHVMSQSIDDAFAAAKKQNKIVMIVVKSPQCTQCNEVAEQGLSGSVAVRTIDASAVLVKVDKLPEFLNDPFSLYFMPTEFFGVIYADANRNVLRVYHGSSSLYVPYLDNLDKAVKEKDSGESMASLVTDYYSKKGGFETSMKLITKIIATGLEPKDEVINELVHAAPPDSASSITFLQFVERAAPSIGSAAHQYTTKNNDNYNTSWYRMEGRERSAINNRSYQKSLSKAIAEKDMNAAYQLSAARQGMFRSSGPAEAMRAGQEVLLRYYRGIKDSSNYFMQAPRYYDTYFMTIGVDSVKKADSARTASLLRSLPADLPKQAIPGAIVRTQAVPVTPLAAYYGNALNEGAWSFYTQSKTPLHLAKALLWARRSVEFYEVPESMDTYARLLYATHNTAAAIEWETKAVNALKARKRNADNYDKVLTEMKRGATRIDEY